MLSSFMLQKPKADFPISWKIRHQSCLISFRYLNARYHFFSLAFIISCAKTAHDQHSSFAECINAFFSLALIISYPCNVRTRHPLLQPFCCFALLSQTHSLYSILSAFHPPLTLCEASYQVLSLLNDLFCFLFVC